MLCKKCNGVGLPSKGLLNTLVSAEDFGNDAGSIGSTQYRGGQARLVDCLKCNKCGHSWIPDNGLLDAFLKADNGTLSYPDFAEGYEAGLFHMINNLYKQIYKTLNTPTDGTEDTKGITFRPVFKREQGSDKPEIWEQNI